MEDAPNIQSFPSPEPNSRTDVYVCTADADELPLRHLREVVGELHRGRGANRLMSALDHLEERGIGRGKRWD